MLSLSVEDLDKMRVEFPDVYETLYNDGHNRYKSDRKFKKQAKNTLEKANKPVNSRFAQLFMKDDETLSTNSDQYHDIGPSSQAEGFTAFAR